MPCILVRNLPQPIEFLIGWEGWRIITLYHYPFVCFQVGAKVIGLDLLSVVNE